MSFQLYIYIIIYISSYIAHLDANNLYGWAISQKLPVNDFKWVEKSRLLEFNEDFIKNMMKIEIQDIFLKQMQSIQKSYLIATEIYHFYPKEKRLKRSKKVFVVQKTKKICYSHKSFKTSTKSWLKTKKGTHSNSI